MGHCVHPEENPDNSQMIWAKARRSARQGPGAGGMPAKGPRGGGGPAKRLAKREEDRPPRGPEEREGPPTKFRLMAEVDWETNERSQLGRIA